MSQNTVRWILVLLSAPGALFAAAIGSGGVFYIGSFGDVVLASGFLSCSVIWGWFLVDTFRMKR